MRIIHLLSMLFCVTAYGQTNITQYYQLASPVLDCFGRDNGILGWNPSYISGGTTYNTTSPYHSVVNPPMSTIPYTGGNVNSLYLSSNSVLAMSSVYNTSYSTIATLKAGFDNYDHRYLVLNFAAVAGQYTGTTNDNLLKITASVTIGGTTTVISTNNYSYSSLTTSGASQLDNGVMKSIRYQDWTNLLFDFSPYYSSNPADYCTVKVELVSDSNDSYSFMKTYLDFESICYRNIVNSNFTLCSDVSTPFYSGFDEPTYSTTWHFGTGDTGTGNPAYYAYPNTTNSGSYMVYTPVIDITINGSTPFTFHPPSPTPTVTVIPTISGSIAVSGPPCGKTAEYTFSHPGTSLTGETWLWDFGDGTPQSSAASPSHIYNQLGTYQVTLTFRDGDKCGRTFYTNVVVSNCPIDCEDCITDLSLPPGEYIISAWVKEVTGNYTTTNYTAPHIDVVTTMTQSFHASGPVIDGWQRIEGLFEVTGSGSLSFQLISPNNDAYFDDIRVFPYDGTMVTYVYDPITLRLMAELDERNYAKLYEYDEEGKLIRVKKETENGVMTIQENVENSPVHAE